MKMAKMKRRNFLQTLLGLAGTTALPANSNKLDQQQTEPLKLLQTSIAGFQYYEGERLFNQLNIGDPLQLRRAPENKYDKRAVEIYWQSNMLGHLPRMANMSVSQMMDRGEQINARITKLTQPDNTWQCITLIIEWNNENNNEAG